MKNAIPELREPFRADCKAMAEALKAALGRPPYTDDSLRKLFETSTEVNMDMARAAAIFVIGDFVRNWWDELSGNKPESGNGGAE